MRFPIHLPALLLLALVLQAQGPVAPKAGLIYFAEGTVLLNEEPLAPGEGQLLFVEEGGKISTGLGRAELLIGPANYARLGENTAVRLLASDFSEVVLQLERGAIILDVERVPRQDRITLQLDSSQVRIARRGLYRVDHTSVAQLKVFDGHLQVETAGDTSLLTEGWMLDLPAAPPIAEPRKFPRKQKDALDLWSADRGKLLDRLRNKRRGDPTTLGGELQPLYVPQTSPRGKRFPDGSN